MAQPCPICLRPDRDSIDALLIAGGLSVRAAARQLEISKSSVGRHRHHLRESVVKAREGRETIRGDRLLEHLHSLQERALQILARAESSGNLFAACAAIREARSLVELQGKFLGELKPKAAVEMTSYTIIFEGGRPKAIREGAVVEVKPQQVANGSEDR